MICGCIGTVIAWMAREAKNCSNIGPVVEILRVLTLRLRWCCGIGLHRLTWYDCCNRRDGGQNARRRSNLPVGFLTVKRVRIHVSSLSVYIRSLQNYIQIRMSGY